VDTPEEDSSPAAEDALDGALRLLTGRSPEFGGGLSDHGPMAADAIVRLGARWEVSAWTCRYAERLEPASAETLALRERIRSRIEASSWQAVVADMTPLLLPGVLAGAFHAVIRVAHAMRMVGARDTDLRRAELAAGLAYWVQARLPLGDRPRVDGRNDPRVLMEQLPAPPTKGEHWLIGELAAAAASAPGFAAAIDEVELPEEPISALHALSELGRDLFLAQPHAPIAYVHAVTGPQAVAALVPLLDRTSAQEAVGFTWQAMCAVHAAYRRPPVDPGTPGTVPTWAELVRRVVADGDEHGIKLALACVRGDTLRPDPRWRRAAARISV
jgi:hypothetical protein